MEGEAALFSDAAPKDLVGQGSSPPATSPRTAPAVTSPERSLPRVNSVACGWEENGREPPGQS